MKTQLKSSPRCAFNTLADLTWTPFGRFETDLEEMVSYRCPDFDD